MANNRDGLVQHMRQWFSRHRIETNATFITGVSGGLDSMVLVEALHRVGVEVHVAHVNYHLRGEASDADQAWSKGVRHVASLVMCSTPK